MDTETTGKKLLQKGELKRRYTIIPLNKIAARSISGDTVKAAQNLVWQSLVLTDSYNFLVVKDDSQEEINLYCIIKLAT